MSTRAGQVDNATSHSGRTPTEYRLMLGRRLRRHREDRAISTVAAARAIGVTDATLSALEHGWLSVVQLKDVLSLCDLYTVRDHDERTELLDLARQGNEPGWWAGFADIIPTWFEPYLALEQTAARIRSFDVQFVPGLLQTPEYARAVIRMDEGRCSDFELEHRLALRMLRQRRLTAPDAPQVWALVDEAALRRRVGDRPTMFRQLQYLADVCLEPWLRIQILPLTAAGHFTGGPIILLSPLGGLEDIVYLEQLTTALYLEAPGEVLYYRHVLNSLATIAPEPAKTPEILRQIMHDV